MKPIEMISLVSGKHEFVDRFIRGCLKRQIEEDKWIEDLRNRGIKAAHPDDGHVDRKNNTINFAYPDFNDGLEQGCLVALGSPRKYRIIKLVKHLKEECFLGVIYERKWKFENSEEKII